MGKRGPRKNSENKRLFWQDRFLEDTPVGSDVSQGQVVRAKCVAGMRDRRPDTLEETVSNGTTSVVHSQMSLHHLSCGRYQAPGIQQQKA